MTNTPSTYSGSTLSTASRGSSLSSIDIVAGVVAALMIWGPLLAGSWVK